MYIDRSGERKARQMPIKLTNTEAERHFTTEIDQGITGETELCRVGNDAPAVLPNPEVQLSPFTWVWDISRGSPVCTAACLLHFGGGLAAECGMLEKSPFRFILAFLSRVSLGSFLMGHLCEVKTNLWVEIAQGAPIFCN